MSHYGSDMANAKPALTLPPGYHRWQDRLARTYFADRAGQPVVLFLDRNDLDDLADTGADAVRSLVDAVRTVVDPDRGTAMFEAAGRLQAKWERGPRDVPPPTLPILALSVVAASEMHRDAAGAAHAYYIRLAQLLLPDGTHEDVEDLRNKLGQQGAFTDVVGMWRRLREWLIKADGAFGISTIPAAVPAHQARIGYPLSQTLVRRSDRAVLTRFFDRLDIQELGVPTPAALIKQLRIWTHGRTIGFSQRFLEALDDPDVQGLLPSLVHELAASWNGEIITDDGRRRLDIRLALDIDGRELRWVVPATAALPADALTGTSDGSSFSITLTASEYGASFFDAEGVPPVTRATLTEGLKATAPACVAEFKPSALLVFVESSDAGGWVSTDSIRAFEEHLFVVWPEMRESVETVLAEAADNSWKALDGARVTSALAGTRVYENIVFSDEKKAKNAHMNLPVKLAGAIRFGSAVRARLVNGLPLHRNLSRNTYLIGGEPDLELPAGTEPRKALVAIDNEVDEIAATMFPYPVSRSIEHAVGEHLVEADDESLPFTVLDGAGEEIDPPRVGAVSWEGGVLGKREQLGEVCGAWTGERVPNDVVLIRRGAVKTWILDRRGRVTTVDEPPLPKFALQLPDLPQMYYEMNRSRGAWLLQKRKIGLVLTPLRLEEPAFTDLTPDELEVWREAAYSVRAAGPIWALYARAWENACER